MKVDKEADGEDEPKKKAPDQKEKKKKQTNTTARKQGHKAPDWLCSYLNWQQNRNKLLHARG